MAYSTQTAVSDGTLESLPLTIEYIDQENITVIVDLNDGEGPKEYAPGTIWDWVGTEAIQFEAPLPNGAVVVLRRATEVGTLLNKFTTGAMFNAPTLDENFDQMLFLVQEAREGAGLTGVFNALNMHGFRIRNLGNGIDDRDAANIGQVRDLVRSSPELQRTLRVAREEEPLAQLPGPEVRGGKLLAFDSAGRPTVAAPVEDSATDVRLDLADPDKGAALVARGLVAVDSIADLLALPVGQRKEGIRYAVTSYHGGWGAELPYIGPLGGGYFSWVPGDVSDDDGGLVFAVPGVPAGRYRRYAPQNSTSIEEFGARPVPGRNNRDSIMAALYSGKKLVSAGPGVFETTPLQVGRDADGVRFEGDGRSTVLSLVGDYSLSAAALVHIPRVGDPYGGTVEGARDFTVDNIRLYGGDATGNRSTSGLVVYDSQGFSFGTVWAHGFYKSGGLVAGTVSGLVGGTFIGYDNGNHAGAIPSGQGFAIATSNSNPGEITIERIVGVGNGLGNYGQAFDAASGSCSIGSVVAIGNGASSMKIAGSPGRKVLIGTLVSSGNHSGLTTPFPAVYSNADFGLLSIETLIVDGHAAGSGLSIKHAGRVDIGSLYITGIGAYQGVDYVPPANSVSSLNIKTATLDGVGGIGVTASGNMASLYIGRLSLQNVVGNGLFSSIPRLHVDSLESRDGSSYAANIAGSPISCYIGHVHSETDDTALPAVRLNSTVSGAVVVSASCAGSHARPIRDDGIDNITPRPRVRHVVLYNPPSIAPGASSPVLTAPVEGIEPGDFVECSFSLDLRGVVINSWVSAPGVLSYYAHNPAGNPEGTVDLGSGSVRFLIHKPPMA